MVNFSRDHVFKISISTMPLVLTAVNLLDVLSLEGDELTVVPNRRP